MQNVSLGTSNAKFDAEGMALLYEEADLQYKAKPLRKYRPEHTCHCNAYPFPHRATSGACTDPGEEPSSCGDCSFSVSMSDPYGTGDRWYSITECNALNGCPWKRG